MQDVNVGEKDSAGADRSQPVARWLGTRSRVALTVIALVGALALGLSPGSASTATPARPWPTRACRSPLGSMRSSTR